MKKDPRIPDFFGVGAAKSGTTSLWKYLGQHPEVFATKTIDKKELGYYSHDYGCEDEDQYLSFFNGREEHQKVVEFCHTYLTTKESAAKIKEANPDARIMIILRHPADRAYSQYHWLCAHGYETSTSFEMALSREDERFIGSRFRNNCPHYFWNFMYRRSSHYSEQVARYQELFPNQVKTFIYEDFNQDPQSILAEICAHLRISTIDFDLSTRFNKGRRTYWPPLQFALKNYLRRYKHRPTKGLRKKLMNMNSSGVQQPMKPETRKELLAYFEPQTSQLEALLEVNLDHWRV